MQTQIALRMKNFDVTATVKLDFFAKFDVLVLLLMEMEVEDSVEMEDASESERKV